MTVVCRIVVVTYEQMNSGYTEIYSVKTSSRVMEIALASVEHQLL